MRTRLLIIIGLAITGGVFGITCGISQFNYYQDLKQLEEWRDIRESVLSEIREKKLNNQTTTETVSIMTEEERCAWYFDWSNQTHYIDSENCKWIEREWYEGEQFEKIIKYCTDPESNLTGETSSISKGGEIKLDSKNCTWFHGGFYNQAWINQTSDPVPLIQNGNVMSPEGKVIRSVK